MSSCAPPQRQPPQPGRASPPPPRPRLTEIHEAEIVEPPAIPANGNGTPPRDDQPPAGAADDGTLTVEDPPDWPETAKPGTGTPKGK